MHPLRPIAFMSLRALLLLSAQLALIGAQHRGEYAVVLNDPPLARQVGARKLLASASTAKIRGAQAAVRASISARHIRVHGSTHTLVNAIFIRASADEAETLRN